MSKLMVAIFSLCAAASPPPKTGGGFDLRPRVLQVSNFSGTTNVGLQPKVAFLVRGGGEAQALYVAKALRSEASFVEAGGRSFKAKVEMTPTLRPNFDYELTITPSKKLAPDRWYVLRIEREVAFKIGSIDDDGESEGAMSIHLYTGSAPYVRKLVRLAGDPNKPRESIDVIMSEPIELGALVREGFGFGAGSETIAGCVAWENGCAKPGDKAATSAFSFRYSEQRSQHPAGDLEVRWLSQRTNGSPQTVGAAEWKQSPGGAEHWIAPLPGRR